MIESIARGMGLVPRSLQRALVAMLLISAATAGCIWLVKRFGLHVETMSILVLAFPLRRRSAFETWTSLEGTEWMLASGSWTRAMLARSLVFEIFVLAFGAAAGVAWASSMSPDTDVWSIVPHPATRPPGSTFAVVATAVLFSQSLRVVVANWNSSTRVPGRLRFPRIQNQEIASTLRIAFVVGVAWVFVSAFRSDEVGWTGLVRRTGFALPFVLLWLVTGAEGVRAGQGIERVEAKHARIRAHRFAAWPGLIWSGMRPITRVLVALPLALPLVIPIGRWFGWQVNGDTLHFWNMVLIVWIAGSPAFRWETRGTKAEFLCTSGVKLRDARRVELLSAIVLSVELIVVGLLIDFASGIEPRVWIEYGLAIGVLLLLSNFARVPSLLGRALRVRDQLPHFALVGVLLIAFFVVFGLMTQNGRESEWRVLFFVLLAAFVLASMTLWIWAFWRASDDERLRVEELEPKFYRVKRR